MSRKVTLGNTLDFKFVTKRFDTNVPTALLGTPTISIYPANSTTELGPSTANGITLTVEFDSVVGYNNVNVVATTANGYLVNTDYEVMISAGTVNSISVVGDKVGEFRTEGAMTEGYAADGVAPTESEMLYMIWSKLGESNVDGLTVTTKKIDGSTIAMTFTLDDANAPTTITRAT